MTEKLVVLLLGVMIIVPAIALMGPVIQEKFAFVNTLLGGSNVETLADRPPAKEASNIGFYVTIFILAFGSFFAVFVAPLLFPRARITRQNVMNALAERFPFMEPLADWHAKGMEELYRLNAELQNAPKVGALQVKSRDLGDVGDPNEVTAPRDALKAPGVADYLREEAPLRDEIPRRDAPIPAANPMPATAARPIAADWQPQSMPGAADAWEPTSQMAPLAKPPVQNEADMSLLTSIPMAEIDPLGERNLSSKRILPRDTGPRTGGHAPVPTTGRTPVRPQTGGFPGVTDDSDATIVHPRSNDPFGNLPNMDLIAGDDETTINLDDNPLRGTIRDARDADDPDATTRPSHDSYKPK